MVKEFNTEVFGTTGWSKFSVPMVAGTRASQMAEYNQAFDNLIGVLKRNSAGATSPQYLAAFNTLSVQLHAIGELIIDGKATI